MLFSSLNLSILDWLIQQITIIVLFFVDIIMLALKFVFGGILFSIGAQLLSLLDFVQNLFRTLAGLDTYSYGQWHKSEDLILKLFMNGAVQDVIWALTFLSIIILIISVVIQIVRTEITTEGSKNAKGPIIATAFKSLMYFALVPITSFCAILLSNALLMSLDRATSVGGAATIGANVFTASAYNANVVRSGAPSQGNSLSGSKFPLPSVYEILKPSVKNGKVSWQYKGKAIDIGYKNHPEDSNIVWFIDVKGTGNLGEKNLAEMIDTAFRQGRYVWVDGDGAAEFAKDTNLEKSGGKIQSVYTYTNGKLARQFYNVNNMNFLILFAAGGVCLYCLIMAAFAMIKRVFNSILLLIVSPPVVGIMPLDNGTAFNNWFRAFKEELLTSYGVIIALNIFILILPLIETINLFPPTIGGNAVMGAFAGDSANKLVHLLFTIVGCLLVKDSPDAISGLIGGKNAIKEGESTAKSVGGAISTAANVGENIRHKVAAGIDERKARKAQRTGQNLERVQELRARAQYHRKSAKAHGRTVMDKAAGAFGITKADLQGAREGLDKFAEGRREKNSAANVRDRIANGKASWVDKHIRNSDSGIVNMFRSNRTKAELAEDEAAQADVRKKMAIDTLTKSQGYQDLDEDKQKEAVRSIEEAKDVQYDDDGNMRLVTGENDYTHKHFRGIHRIRKKEVKASVDAALEKKRESLDAAKAALSSGSSGNGEKGSVYSANEAAELELTKAKDAQSATINSLSGELREFIKDSIGELSGDKDVQEKLLKAINIAEGAQSAEDIANKYDEIARNIDKFLKNNEIPVNEATKGSLESMMQLQKEEFFKKSSEFTKNEENIEKATKAAEDAKKALKETEDKVKRIDSEIKQMEKIVSTLESGRFLPTSMEFGQAMKQGKSYMGQEQQRADASVINEIFKASDVNDTAANAGHEWKKQQEEARKNKK